MGRICDFEDTPLPTTFLVTVELACFIPGSDEVERGREVIPERVAEEIRQVQVIPWGCEIVAGEGGAGVVSCLEYRAVVVLRPASVRGVDPAVSTVVVVS